MSVRGVVAAGHPLTAGAAERLLRDGGNAFDAVLGAMCAACVVEPVLASLGGGGFLLARTDAGRDVVYDFFVHTPRRPSDPARLDFRPVVADFGAVQQSFHIGLGSIATPGIVRGLFEAHRDLGRLPIGEILAPAIEHARDGVSLNAFQAYAFSIVAAIYLATPESRALYARAGADDRPLGPGDVLRQPEQAAFLEALAREGDALFYEGEVARSIAAMCERGGGALGLDDLRSYRVARREPLGVPFRGAKVLTNPPPSSGGVLIAFALKLLEAAGGDGARFGGAAHLARLARVLELTDRAKLEAHLDRTTACPDAARLLDGELLRRYREELHGRGGPARGTTHIGVIDARGNVASLTMSNGEGCGHLAPGTGIMLNNMLGEDDLHPHGFHCWQPDQRMTSMMSPTLLFPEGGGVVATGSGGSKRIRAAILQVLANVVDHGMSVEDAVAAPRMAHEDGALNLEPGFDAEAVRALEQTWQRCKVWPAANLYFGGAHTVEHRDGRYRGAGDTRRGGVCTVVE